MFKSCSKCGRVHRAGEKCHSDARVKIATEESRLRSTYKWTQKSIEVREKAHYLCEVCRDQGVLTYKGTQVHHIDALKERADLLLENTNLICLCEWHHEQAERGEIDKDYLRKLAQRREGEIPPPHP